MRCFARRLLRINANHTAMLCCFFILLNVPNGCNDRNNDRESRWLNDIENLHRHNNAKIAISQGVAGTVVFTEGNCMPPIIDNATDPTRCMRYPVQRTIHVYESTHNSQAEDVGGGFHRSLETRKITTVQSDAEGFFGVDLPPGNYSLFIEEDGKLYANRWDGKGNIQTVDIQPGEVKFVQIDITYSAVF